MLPVGRSHGLPGVGFNLLERGEELRADVLPRPPAGLLDALEVGQPRLIAHHLVGLDPGDVARLLGPARVHPV